MEETSGQTHMDARAPRTCSIHALRKEGIVKQVRRARVDLELPTEKLRMIFKLFQEYRMRLAVIRAVQAYSA